MEKRNFHWLPILIAIVLLMSMTVASMATGSTALVLEASQNSAAPGAEITVTLSVTEHTGFSQLTTLMQYDPAALSYVTHDFSAGVFSADVLTVETDTAGSLRIAIGAMPTGEDGVVPNHEAFGQILTVTFRVNEAYVGSTSVTTVTDPTQVEGLETAFTDGVCDILVENAAPHIHTEQPVQAIAPTCTEPGWSAGIKCSECGEVLVVPEYIEPLGHLPGDEVHENPVSASCQSDGSYESVTYCVTCNAELNRQTVIVPTTGEHNFVTEQERVDPGCLTDGYVIFACGCGETQTQTLPATGHTEETDAAIAPTCTEAGLTAGSHCAACGQILVAQETVPATGHDEKVEPAIAPTCTESGWTEGTVCAVCGDVVIAREEIPASGHTQIHVSAVAPTCSTYGAKAGIKCDACGLVLEGCDRVEKLAHTEATIPGTAPTCATPGKTDGKYCTACGEVTQAQKEIATVAHTPETIPSVEATCSEEGWTEGVQCAVCNEILEEPQALSRLTHTAQELAGYPATCEKTGLTEGQICAECGEVLLQQTPIPQLEHDYDHSCDPDCNACGAVRASLKHTYSGWYVTREATNKVAGERARTCMQCGCVDTQVLAILPDNSEMTVALVIGYTVMTACAAVLLYMIRKKRAQAQQQESEQQS